MAESTDPAVATPLTPLGEEQVASGADEHRTADSTTEPIAKAESRAAESPSIDAASDSRTTAPEAVGSKGAADVDASSLRDCIAAAEQRIVELFEKKLSFDQFKEQQIERLHAELQEYKRGFAESILLPLVKQVVRYADQIPRHVAALRKKPVDELGPERLFRELEGVRADLELILENIGVTLFHSPAVEFDAKIQQARSTEAIGDSAQHGRIVERLLPGYEINGRVIEKERVKVYVYQQGGPVPSDPAAEGR